MSLKSDSSSDNPLQQHNEDEKSVIDDCTDNASKKDEVNSASDSSSRKKLIRDAMMDILVSIILLILTTLVTYGDFQKSPTASSILASGTSSIKSIKTFVPKFLSFPAATVDIEGKGYSDECASLLLNY